MEIVCLVQACSPEMQTSKMFCGNSGFGWESNFSRRASSLQSQMVAATI